MQSFTWLGKHQSWFFTAGSDCIFFPKQMGWFWYWLGWTRHRKACKNTWTRGLFTMLQAILALSKTYLYPIEMKGIKLKSLSKQRSYINVAWAFVFPLLCVCVSCLWPLLMSTYNISTKSIVWKIIAMQFVCIPRMEISQKKEKKRKGLTDNQSVQTYVNRCISKHFTAQ